MTSAPVPDLWDRVTAVAPAPGLPLVLVTAALAVVGVTTPGAWHRCRHLLTVAHEGAHALAAVAAGRRLGGVRLHADGSGLTVSSGRARGPGTILVFAAGYLGPGLLGLLGAVLLAAGHPLGLLWLLLVLVALLLLQLRSLFGLVPVLLTGVVLAVVTRWAAPEVQTSVALTVTWFLLLGAPRDVLDLQRQRRRGSRRDRTSDAAELARLTHLPAALWAGVLLVGTLACLLLGGAALLRAA